MTGQEAGDVLALLVAAFPDAALDDESSSFFVSEIARLTNYEAAIEAARITARESRKFPSLAEFRQTYRSRAEARKPLELEPAHGPQELPADVRAYLERALPKGMEEPPPPKLPAAEDGACEDCGKSGERVRYAAKRNLCRGCAGKRQRAARRLAETVS